MEKRTQQKELRKKIKRHEFREWARANYEEGKTLHLTLTFHPKVYDTATANNAFRNLRKQLGITHYMHVLETHESGGYHIHAIIFKIEYLPFLEIKTRWGAFANIERVKSIDGLLEYLVPYLQAGEGTYTYYKSRNLTPPILHDAWEIFGKEIVRLRGN